MKRIKGFIQTVYGAIKDPEREFSERVFLIFSIIADLAALVALIGDLYIHESPGEIITLLLIFVLVPAITFTCLYSEKIRFAIRFLIIGLVFGILPALFFLGGGLNGGGFIWIVFGFMYIGLVISGKWRNIMLVLLFLLTLACFLISYYNPMLTSGHSRREYYIDTFISLVLVGIVCFAMTWAQNMLFKDENARAKKAAERAEELTRAQNRFFSSMSHEIRTPINSILGLNELILRDENASDEVLRDAAGIQGAGKLLLTLINDILDFSRMEAGSMDIVQVDYRVGDLLSEIVNMIWLKAEEKGLKFNVNIDPSVPSVLYGDEVRIKQIIINLLNNAVKYTAEGSIDLRIDSEDVDERTTMLSISISDTGTGIKKEALPHLFEAFRRVDEEKNRYIEGTGLGLSIVKQFTELMGGTVTVNSIYGEGSTFTVTLEQGISDSSQIGDLNIHSQGSVNRGKHESAFTAPDARILIVDDNEMNLEVERKLLVDTKLTIDTALSGRDALEMTVRSHYDVILMDHLMPEMDGIECLSRIRSQTGGLNRTTPVVVLTANAGSSNRDLYNRAGFDGYLVKPVSGEALENTLMVHIPKERLIVSSKMVRMREDINTTAGYARKLPVIITTASMSDIPDSIIRKLNIPIIPFLIHTEEGVFKDGVQMDANELIRYISSGRDAFSSPPDVGAYTEFFAGALKRAHHLIHISLTTSMSEDFNVASEAAGSFDNVTVVNSGCVSSATGLLVLIACKLAQQNIPAEEIVRELEAVRERLRCSFVIDDTEYMARRNLISKKVHNVAKALNLHIAVRFRDNRYGTGGIWSGSTRRAYKKYISKAFPVDIIPDSDVVFITYADVPMYTLKWIKEEISKLAYFEHVVFKQASAAISSNCGPGTFGILYFVKSNKSYNLGSFIDDEEETGPAEVTDAASGYADAAPQNSGIAGIRGIDFGAAIANSGSENAFMTVLKIFYDSVPVKSSELDRFYSAQDWDNYTIKIHALKSSAKLIGALTLADDALKLETAGKDGDIAYILENHTGFMNEYRKFAASLSKLFTDAGAESTGSASQKPVADEALMESVYEELKSAADEMDCSKIEEILKELDDYSIPEKDGDRFARIREKAAAYDYDGILDELGES